VTKEIAETRQTAKRLQNVTNSSFFVFGIAM